MVSVVEGTFQTRSSPLELPEINCSPDEWKHYEREELASGSFKNLKYLQ